MTYLYETIAASGINSNSNRNQFTKYFKNMQQNTKNNDIETELNSIRKVKLLGFTNRHSNINPSHPTNLTIASII